MQRRPRVDTLVSVAVVLSALAGRAHADPPLRGELEIETHLLAPCCWSQTLDVHESELATELRREIHQRLSKGEPIAAVESRIVARYGGRILVAPRGSMLPTLLLGGLALVSVASVLLSRRLFRRPLERAPLKPGARDALDDRIDDELRAMDD